MPRRRDLCLECPLSDCNDKAAGCLIRQHDAALARERYRRNRDRYRAVAREKQRARRAADPERFRAESRQYKRDWRAANREHVREYRREYMRQYRARKRAEAGTES